MNKRVWIRSGVVEELDAKQQRLLDLVMEKIEHYYRDLHETRPCYRYPLSLSRLSRLCKRSNAAVINAVRILANTVPEDSQQGTEPRIWYDRVQSEKHKAKRPYRIFLKEKK